MNIARKHSKIRQWLHSGTLLGILLTLLLAGTALAAGPAAPATMDLTLDQAVQLALTNNPSGKIAVFDYEAAKGALTAARSYRWPTISGTHRDSRTLAAPSEREPNPTTIDNYSNSISFSWILWSGNKIESQISQAKLSLDSSQWGIAAARQ